MTSAPIRLVLLFGGAVLAAGFTQARSCGYEPDPLKGEGEPCTRTDECQTGLECRGGVCMIEGFDGGPGFDAGHPDTGVPSFDAGPIDASVDGSVDGSTGDAGNDASVDASIDASIDSGP